MSESPCQFSRCLNTIEFRVALILPVTDLLEDMRHFEVSQILRLFIANFGWNLQPQGSSMFPGQRPVVHLIAQKCLRMQRGSHVERFVIVICAFNYDEPCSRVGTDHLEEV